MAEAMLEDIAVVLDAVREVAEARIAPAAAEVDRTTQFPQEGLRALAEVGGLGLLVATDHGGAGGGLSALAAACEAVGRGCASTGMAFLMHAVASATIGGGGGTRAGELMEAKVRCTDTGPRVTQQALEVCGGQGYTPSLPIERHLRDGRAGAVMAPTNGVLRTWIGKAPAGLPVP